MRKAIMVLAAAALVLGCSRRPAPTPVSAPTAPQTQPAPATAPAQTQQISPGKAEYDAGLAAISKGDWAGARAHLKKAAELDPNLAEAWNDLAYALVRKSNLSLPLNAPNVPDSEAVAAARRALTANPQWPAAQYNLGFALLAQGRYAAAVEPLRQSGLQQPDRPEPPVALGLALLGAGQADEAAAACQQADRLQPGYRWAKACLEAAAPGAKRLPDSEAAVGSHIYTAGKGWSAPAGSRESVGISPPTTCADRFPDGWQESYIMCGRHDWDYMWSATRKETGTTPAGIGVGSPWASVVKAYGPTYQAPQDALFYRVADLMLVIQGNEKDGVSAVQFRRITPYFILRDWMNADD